MTLSSLSVKEESVGVASGMEQSGAANPVFSSGGRSGRRRTASRELLSSQLVLLFRSLLLAMFGDLAAARKRAGSCCRVANGERSHEFSQKKNTQAGLNVSIGGVLHCGVGARQWRGPPCG